jgi:hypothetical protein
MGFYTSIYELEAMKWLQRQHTSGSVVLADEYSSQRIARYTGCSVVAAHYSVTPRFEQQATVAAKLLQDTLITTGRQPMPDSVRVSYLYLKNDTLPQTPNMPYLKEVYRNEEVAIYKVK